MPDPVPSLDLRPGDCLLYRGRGLFSWLIRVKTWSAVSHCEGVVNPDREQVIAARTTGVHAYTYDPDRLYAVLRPVAPVDVDAAMAWFARCASGQRYHYWGLLRFFLLGRRSAAEAKKMFCSELLVRWYRAGGFTPFAPGYDADATSPGMFLSSPNFTVIWTRKV